MPSTTQTTYRKKLIEVDLPLDEINAAIIKDRRAPGRAGQPSGLHQWWARRPITACRAILWASLVDDPSSCPKEFPTIEDQVLERQRLHHLLTQLVKWESAENQGLLTKAKREIALSVARANNDFGSLAKDSSSLMEYLSENAPFVYDPFCGGGSIPLEAQRLGVKPLASDLNPVATLITKAMIEIPPNFANKPPINPDADLLDATVNKRNSIHRVSWRGATGMANDIRFYGRWVRNEAFKRIGRFYPDVELDDGSNATVMTWLWIRTVRCPNPACMIQMPLLRTFQISKKRGQERWLKPDINYDKQRVDFRIQNHANGIPTNGTASGKGIACLVCGTVSSLSYLRQTGLAIGLGSQLAAIVAEGNRGRRFLPPTELHEQIATYCEPSWEPPGKLPQKARSISTQIYGFTDWHSHFTPRQKLALTTMYDVVEDARSVIAEHNNADDGYPEAICTYLSLAAGKLSNAGNSFTVWDSTGHAVKNMFARQGIGMTWDFPEANPFSKTGKNWISQLDSLAKTVETLPADGNIGRVWQASATSSKPGPNRTTVITDPPYYDNIHYSDSSDFFYIWLRRSLREIYPELFSAMLTPKNEEIVANRFRSDNAEQEFENRLALAIKNIRTYCDPDVPSSMFYAYKQHTDEQDGRSSTGWDTMLNALTNGGFQIVATWPIRTELTTALKRGINALATSVVLVIRPRPDGAPVTTRQQFFDELDTELPTALDQLTRGGHIAPADLPQAAIGPGMEIYSKYNRVETISGEPVTVREALQQINRVIGAYFDREEGELDIYSRFCVDWLKTHCYKEGPYGEAETIALAKNLSVSDITTIHQLADNKQRGIIKLHPISEYHPNRKPPMTDVTAWEGCMRMAYHLDTNNEEGKGVAGCGEVGRRMDGSLDSVERLARILYNHYDNLNQPRNAYIYNQLVSEWQNILDATQSPEQATLT